MYGRKGVKMFYRIGAMLGPFKDLTDGAVSHILDPTTLCCHGFILLNFFIVNYGQIASDKVRTKFIRSNVSVNYGEKSYIAQGPSRIQAHVNRDSGIY